MTANVSLSLLIGVLFGTGISLLMARGIIRAFLGVLLVSNGINLLFVVAAGPSGSAPILSKAAETDMSDPLPQAMTLTAIVITLALTGFTAALAHRAWQLQQSDVITDDPEDVRIHEKAIDNDISDSDFLDDEDDDDEDHQDPGGRHQPELAAEEGRP